MSWRKRAVPLIATNDKGYFMPSAFSVILLASGLPENKVENLKKPMEQDGDHEWSDEEITMACKELRKAVSQICKF